MKYLPVFLILFLLSCIQDIYYKMHIDWDIRVTNYFPYDLTVTVKSNNINYGSRVDSLGSVPVLIKSNSTEILELRFIDHEEDEEPSIDEESEFECMISFQNDTLDTINYAIDLFPFPKWKDSVLCDEYFYLGDYPRGGAYDCFVSFIDTVDIFVDSVFSTAEYFEIIE